MAQQRLEIASNKPDIKMILNIVWRHRALPIATTVFSFLVAVLYLQIASYVYTATLIVTPVSYASSGGSFGRGLGTIANMAGINLNQGNSELSFDLYLAGLTSPLVAQKMSQDPALMHSVFSSYWSPEKNAWQEPGSIFRHCRDGVKRVLGLTVPPWRPPGAFDMESFLENNVKVSKNRQTGIVTITLTYRDPDDARMILNKLNSTVDGILRTRALDRATRAVAYINERLQTSTVTEYREALIQTLSEEEKTRMMASSNLAFSAETFGAATASPLPTWPRQGPIIAFAIIMGAASGIVLAFLLEKYRAWIANFVASLGLENVTSVRWLWRQVARRFTTKST